MRGSKGYDSFQEFAREELHACRTNAWSIDELVDDFILGDDLDLDLIEGDREEEPADDEED